MILALPATVTDRRMRHKLIEKFRSAPPIFRLHLREGRHRYGGAEALNDALIRFVFLWNILLT